jgi:branched-chain amino acid transport system permease protein
MEPSFAERLWNWCVQGIRLPLLVATILLAVFGMFYANPYELRTLSLCAINALMVIGFQFVFGHAGAVSLAQATFFGLGAYATGILGASYGLGFLATFPLSCLLPTVVALCIGIPVLKLEDHYFALATLGIGLVVVLVAIQWQSVTGGTNGLPGVPPIEVLGFSAARRFPMFVVAWAFVALGGIVAYQVMRGLYGRAFEVMRESHSAAECMGIDVARLRFTAFLLSACYAGAAGALMAHLSRVVSPENLELPVMVTCLTMTVIGGRTRIAGAILGASLVIYLREWFRILENFYLMAYGAAALAILIVAPYGLVGAAERLRERLFPTLPAQAPAHATLRFDERAATKGEPLLVVSDVAKAFGGLRALDGVSFTVAEGEIIGLIGPNGSGKTTLLNSISGLYQPDRGSIRFLGQEIAGNPAHRIARLGIARTFQHINLADDLTVLDNIAVARFANEGAGLRQSLASPGPDPALRRARAVAMTAADMMGVSGVAMQACGKLPYGTKRRVEVARALAAAPQLLLLDEPAAGLNEEEQRDFASRIRESAAQGLTILIIEHNLVFLQALVGRMICLERGRIIAQGTPAEVQQNQAVIEAYLGRDDSLAPDGGDGGTLLDLQEAR